MAYEKEWKFMKHRRHIMEIHSLCLFTTNVSNGIYQHLLSHAFINIENWNSRWISVDTYTWQKTKESSYVDHQIMLQRKSEWAERGPGGQIQSPNTHLTSSSKLESHPDGHILCIPTHQTFCVKTYIFAFSNFKIPASSDLCSNQICIMLLKPPQTTQICLWFLWRFCTSFLRLGMASQKGQVGS